MDRILRNCWRNMIQACSELDQSKYPSRYGYLFYQQSDPPSLVNNVLLDEFHERFPFVKKLLAKSITFSSSETSSKGISNVTETLVTRNHFLPMYSVFYAGKAYYKPSNIFQKDDYENRLLSLSRVTQYLHLSQQFHLRVANDPNAEKLNKALTLIGDLFITEMYRSLALLNNNQITQIMSDALATAAEGNFPASAEHETEVGTLEAHEALYASSFRCVAILNDLPSEEEMEAACVGALIGNMVHTNISEDKKPLYKKLEITKKFYEWIRLAQQSLNSKECAEPLKMFLAFLEIRRQTSSRDNGKKMR